jgi:hypothetical protein
VSHNIYSTHSFVLIFSYLGDQRDDQLCAEIVRLETIVKETQARLEGLMHGLAKHEANK